MYVNYNKRYINNMVCNAIYLLLCIIKIILLTTLSQPAMKLWRWTARKVALTYQKNMYTWLSIGRCVPYRLAYKFSLPLSVLAL